MYKRLQKSGRFDARIFQEVLSVLVTDEELPPARRDHQLQGDMLQFRECHLAGDILLVYEKSDKPHELTLHKIGTHHEIFGN